MNKFYICNYCGKTMVGKRKPKECNYCNKQPVKIGEVQIKW